MDVEFINILISTSLKTADFRYKIILELFILIVYGDISWDATWAFSDSVLIAFCSTIH